MSEMLRKFGVEEVYDYETLCKDCGVRYGSHAGDICPRDVPTLPRTKPLKLSRPTEMTSLRTIKDKLDGLKQDVSELAQSVAEDYRGPEIVKMFDAIAESQGRLLAALNEIKDAYDWDLLSELDTHLKEALELALADVIRDAAKRKKGKR